MSQKLSDEQTRSLFLPQYHLPQVQPLLFDTKGLGVFQKWKKILTFRREWVLKENYYLYLASFNRYVFVPKGFVFDFASTPRVLWPIVSPTGVLLCAALPHDFGYRFGGLIFTKQPNTKELYFADVPKYLLDRMLADLTTTVCDSALPGKVAEIGLCIGGWPTWNAARKKDYQISDQFPNLKIL
jgi:hypothetical protein